MPRLMHGEGIAVAFRLNGREVRVHGEPRTLLTDALRHALGATGTHVGCEHGVCGACTVQIDGRPARACLVLLPQAEGREIRTIENLASPEGGLSPLQEAFRRNHGLQCGFCTSGILMTLDALLRERPQADEGIIREHLAGHLCRCTGYAGIVRAALEIRDGHAKQEDGHV